MQNIAINKQKAEAFSYCDPMFPRNCGVEFHHSIHIALVEDGERSALTLGNKGGTFNTTCYRRDKARSF